MGRTGGLRGSKGQTWEGGIRMPGLARWPGRVAAGVTTDALVSSLDVLPTLLALAGVPLRTDRLYDGADMTSVLLAADPAAAPSAHEFMFHYCGKNVTAVRHVVRSQAALGDGRETRTLKLHFATQIWTTDAHPSPLCVECCPATHPVANGTLGSMCECEANALAYHDPPLVFDMEEDRWESQPLTRGDFPGGPAAFDAEVTAVRAALAAHYDSVAPARDQMIARPINRLQPCCTGAGGWDPNNKTSCICDTYAPGRAYP